MKFTITKSNFLDGLNHVSRVIAPNSLFEILKGIKIELEKDQLILKASDSLVSVEYSINSYEDDKEITITFLFRQHLYGNARDGTDTA